VHGREHETGGPGQAQEPVDDGVDPLELAGHDALEPLPEPLVVEPPRHVPAERHDRRERILDLVGQAGRQRAQRGEAV